MARQVPTTKIRRKAPPRPATGPAPSTKATTRTEPVSSAAKSTALARIPKTTALARVNVADDLRRADELARNAYASNTRRAYRSDVADWSAYAAKAGVVDLPADPAALAAYIANMEARGLSASTIRRRSTSIANLHRENGKPNPFEDDRLRRVLRGHAREHTVASRGGKTPFTPETMAMVMLHPKVKLRDRALLGVGIVTAIRRGNLVALKWGDIEDRPQGVAVHIRRSKTDKLGKGAVKAIPYSSIPERCPARALQKWREANPGRKKTDLVFPVSTQTVADVVKRAVKLAGLNPDDYGGHSLRAGLATTASDANIPQSEWMGATGHKSHEVASRYARFADAFGNRAYGAMVEAIARAQPTVPIPPANTDKTRRGTAR